MVWKGLTSAAALAVLACGSVARAADVPRAGAVPDVASTSSISPVLLDDMTTMPSSAPSAAAPVSPAAPSGPTTLTPVMYLLDPTSAGQWLEKYKLSITGFVEGGYFYDLNAPRLGNDQPTFVTFPGPYSNRVLLDQADLSVSKSIDSTKSWDWGFLVETGYGTDDAFIHSHGILDNRGPNNPQNQLDLVQANVSLLVPLGSGLTITAGKFVGYLGQELINSTANAFYTHSYSFFYGVTGTNTGITGTYTFAKAVNGNDLTIMAGMTRGWNQSTRDNNGAVDFIGEAKAGITDKLSAIFNAEIGPEAAHDCSNYWTDLELILAYKASDELTLTADILYGDFPHGAPANNTSAQWYGIAAYAGYKFDSYFTPNLRAEWYRDQGGFTTGNSANYYEITAGVDIHPFPDDNILQFLQVRPELRDDYSDKPAFDLAHNGGHGNHNEVTAAMDVIMQF